jgi:hypothetical protein
MAAAAVERAAAGTEAFSNERLKEYRVRAAKGTKHLSNNLTSLERRRQRRKGEHNSGAPSSSPAQEVLCDAAARWAHGQRRTDMALMRGGTASI